MELLIACLYQVVILHVFISLTIGFIVLVLALVIITTKWFDNTIQGFSEQSLVRLNKIRKGNLFSLFFLLGVIFCITAVTWPSIFFRERDPK